MGTCGTMSGTTCAPPPMPDPRCPMVSVLGMSMASCCAPNGMCGLDASLLGMGCVDYATASASTGGLIMTPPPVACDEAGDGGTAEDGGN